VVRRLRLIAPAIAELEEAADWYASKSSDLESRFLDEVRIAQSRICEHPAAWHPLEPAIRRYRLRRFPYGLIYAVENGEVVVLAVAHLHREPSYWRDRLSSKPER
jgi:mRNA-degrading endonuclease RelE of RelBE toxin-antitoxin system